MQCVTRLLKGKEICDSHYSSKQEKSQIKNERKRTLNAVNIIELNELHLNRMKKRRKHKEKEID